MKRGMLMLKNKVINLSVNTKYFWNAYIKKTYRPIGYHFINRTINEEERVKKIVDFEPTLTKGS